MNSVGVSSRALNSATRGLLYLVKDKLYPRLLGSNLVTPYRAPPFGLRFSFITQLRYSNAKIILKSVWVWFLFGGGTS